MENDFKINVYFSEDGEDVEKLLANYLCSLLDKKVVYA